MEQGWEPGTSLDLLTPVGPRQLQDAAPPPPASVRPSPGRERRAHSVRTGPSLDLRDLRVSRRPETRTRGRLGRHSAAATTPGPGIGVGLGLTVLILIGVVGGVSADVGAQQSRFAAAERMERIDSASTARLTTQAGQYAAAQHATALGAARAAITEARDVVVVAAGIVGHEEVAPLDKAVAELGVLVDAASPNLTEPPTASLDPAPPADPPGSTAPGVLDDAPPDPSVASPPTELALHTSARMIQLATEVADLTEQVRTLSDAAVLELAAAQAAAAAQLAAAQAVAAEQAAELARKVAAVEAYPNGAVPHQLLCGVGFDLGVLLRCDAAAALEDLNASFRERFGRDLSVSGSYRDYSTQVATKDIRGALAAEPGTSNHGRGLAVDLNGFGSVGQFDRPFYLWMKDNAGLFGWVHPAYMDAGGAGPLEPWHWEYAAG